MIDSACNFLNPYGSASLAASANLLSAELHTGAPVTSPISSATSSSLSPSAIAVAALSASANGSLSNNLCSGSGIGIGISGSSAPALPNLPASGNHASMKLEMQYPPQAPSTGSASPNSSLSLSASTSASVSPGIFPSPAQSFASISSSPPASALSASPLSGSPAASHQHADIAAAAYWGNTYSGALPTRTQFPYASYAPDYYGNVGMPAGAAWFSHQDRLYQSPWSAAAAGQTYASFNFDDIAFQTQLQRRSVRCTCPNCTNEMSGLPPIVGPDERGRKQHICHIPGCERLYGKASHLKTHLRWHTGERPFLCLTCGKRFSRSDELQRHGRTHTNYRPYACPICSKKFSRSDHLSKHKKTHFKDKKSKKALAAEAKGQTTAIKLEKSEVEKSHMVAVDSNNNNSKSAINSRSSVASSVAAAAKTTTTAATSSNPTMATCLAPSSVKSATTSSSVSSLSDITMQLKTEKPELPSGYNIYNSMYHQNSSLFHAHSHAHLSSAAATAAAYNNLHSNSHQSQHQHQSLPSSATSSSSASAAPSFDLWSSHHHHHYHQQQQHNLNRVSDEQTQANPSTSVPNGAREQQQQSQQQSQQQQLLQQHHQHQQQQLQQQQQSHDNHYAALARQSESQLAAEYGFTISGASDGSSAGSPVHRFQHSSNASAYPGLIRHMKSEYPAYPDFTGNSAYMTTTSAFHHHPHSHNHPWTTATVYPTSHATA